jgi:protein-tyrosine phosphatase
MILPMLEAHRIPFVGHIGGKPILLLEFPHSHIPPGSDKLVEWLHAHGIHVLIAHPERNKDVLRRLDKIRPFVEMGCLLQVTAGALVGLFGGPPRERALEMLEQGWVSVLATDAHDPRFRIPALTAGHAAAIAVVGEAEALALVETRPREWTRGRFVPDAQAA